MKELTFDAVRFSKDIKTKRTIEMDIDMRKLSAEINVSHATISRVENKRMPDLLTFATLCAWLKKPMETYLKTKK